MSLRGEGGSTKQRYVRCSNCHSYKGHLNRAMKMDERNADAFDTWIPEDKAAFKERNLHKVSNDIAAPLYVIMEESFEAPKTDEFGMGDGFLEKQDMAETSSQTRGNLAA